MIAKHSKESSQKSIRATPLNNYRHLGCYPDNIDTCFYITLFVLAIILELRFGHEDWNAQQTRLTHKCNKIDNNIVDISFGYSLEFYPLLFGSFCRFGIASFKLFAFLQKRSSFPCVVSANTKNNILIGKQDRSGLNYAIFKGFLNNFRQNIFEQTMNY